LKDKRVLITGGGGFIGGHLVERLLDHYASVTVVDVHDGDYPPGLTEYKDSIKCFNLDINCLDELHEKFDYVFHLAALSSPAQCEKEPDRAFRTNVQGTYNVLKFAYEVSAEKVIFPSAAALYGRYPEYLPIDEKHPIDIANSVYNATKRIGERLLGDFHESHDLPYISFRIFNAYGPKQSPTYLIPSFIMQAMRDREIVVSNKNTVRDFTYIDDIVDAFVKGAESDYCGGPINLGTGKEHSVGEIAEKIASSFGAKVSHLDREVFGPMRLVCDNSLAKNVLNWVPEVDVDEGIRRTIKYFQDQPKS